MNKISKGMLKVSKVVFAAFCNTVYRAMLLMSEVLKVYSLYSGLSPLQEGRLFEKSSVLWV